MICFTSTMFFGTDDKTLDALIKKVAQKDLTAMVRIGIQKTLKNSTYMHLTLLNIQKKQYANYSLVI